MVLDLEQLARLKSVKYAVRCVFGQGVISQFLRAYYRFNSAGFF